MPDARTIDSLLAANERFYRTFEALDYPAMAALWEDSARVFCCHPGWMPLYGARPVLESWERIIANTGDIHFALSGARATIAGDVGIVTVFEAIHSTVGRERHSSSAVSTNLFGWDDAAGQWKLFHHHASHSVVPEDPETGPLLV
jgi:ketosteroid isomerase-like protein